MCSVAALCLREDYASLAMDEGQQAGGLALEDAWVCRWPVVKGLCEPQAMDLDCQGTRFGVDKMLEMNARVWISEAIVEIFGRGHVKRRQDWRAIFKNFVNRNKLKI